MRKAPGLSFGPKSGAMKTAGKSRAASKTDFDQKGSDMMDDSKLPNVGQAEEAETGYEFHRPSGTSEQTEGEGQQLDAEPEGRLVQLGDRLQEGCHEAQDQRDRSRDPRDQQDRQDALLCEMKHEFEMVHA